MNEFKSIFFFFHADLSHLITHSLLCPCSLAYYFNAPHHRYLSSSTLTPLSPYMLSAMLEFRNMDLCISEFSVINWVFSIAQIALLFDLICDG